MTVVFFSSLALLALEILRTVRGKHTSFRSVFKMANGMTWEIEYHDDQ